jgi:RNA polymerase sigma factor (sigma-70 family)
MLLTVSKTSRLPARSEHDLVAAIRAGNDHAFEELYSRYRERIFAFILSKVHDHGRAEDIAQEVFMSALRRMRGSEQTIAFKPWIYEIAKNACIDEFRRGSRAREVPLEADGEFVVDRQKSSVSRVPTPAAAVESKQRLDDLRGAFGGLSSTHHQLLVMREFEGMSYDEIGERLNMTRQMVESSLFRARRKLGEEYQELASGQRCEQIQTAIESGRLRLVSALGLRDRRRFARHLAHCQPCRHAALMAGVDETLLKPRSIAAKIAALLPFPLWRLPWRSKAARTASAGGSHHVAGAGSAGLVPSAGSALTFGQAAATVAVIVAGAGGGLAVRGLASGGHSHHAKTAQSARRASSTAGGSTTSVATAAGVGASHARSASLRTGHSALMSTGSRTSAAQPRSRRGTRHVSTPGSGTGSHGGSGSAGPVSKQGTTGSRPTASGTATKVVNGVTKTASGVRQAVGGAGKTVAGVTNGVTNGVNKTVHNVTDGVNKTVNGVANTVGKVTSGVSNTVSSATNGAVNPSQAVSGVNQTLTGATNGVTSTGSKVVNGVTGAATGAVQKVASGLTGGSTTSAPSSSGSAGSSGAAGSAGSAGSSGSSGSSGASSGTTSSGSGPLGGLLGGH